MNLIISKNFPAGNFSTATPHSSLLTPNFFQLLAFSLTPRFFLFSPLGFARREQASQSYLDRSKVRDFVYLDLRVYLALALEYLANLVGGYRVNAAAERYELD